MTAPDDKAALQEWIDEAAVRGFATSHGEREEGISAVAAPVFGRSGSVVAALSLSLAPMAARADGYSQQPQYDQYDQSGQQQYQQPYGPQYQQPGIAVGEPMPTDRRFDRGGRYELRGFQQWVQGGYQQVWVPEQCTTRMRQRGWWRQAANVCVPAHYEQRMAPGHYETVQKWVWVPYSFRNHHRWGHSAG